MVCDTQGAQGGYPVFVRATSVMAVVTVANFGAAVEWYERFFGRDADRRPMDGLAEWRLTDTGVVQLVHDPDRAGHALLTLGVPELDETIMTLASRGVATGEVVEGVIARISSITDPEGNTITLAQPDEADSDPAIGSRVGEFTQGGATTPGDADIGDPDRP